MRAASCEAICCERADRRRAECNPEMYCNVCTLSTWRHKNSSTVPEACKHYRSEVAIFATVFFLVSSILCFGLGEGGCESLETGPRFAELSHLNQSPPYYAVLTVYVIQLALF